jgi:hypothetical protein
MENKSSWVERAATNSVPNPADYPLGSPESRAAARALMEARALVSEVADDDQALFVEVTYSESGLHLRVDHEDCIKAIRQHPNYRGNVARVVQCGVIPDDVDEKTKQFLLDRGWAR